MTSILEEQDEAEEAEAVDRIAAAFEGMGTEMAAGPQHRHRLVSEAHLGIQRWTTSPKQASTSAA